MFLSCQIVASYRDIFKDQFQQSQIILEHNYLSPP